MGQKKTRKKNTAKLERSPEVWQTVWGIVILGVGLALGLSLIRPEGAVGTQVSTLLERTFGIGRVVVPVFVLGAGVGLLRKTNPLGWLSFGLYVGIFSILLGIVHLFVRAPLVWEQAFVPQGGGFVGGLIAGAGVWGLGVWGATILLITLFVALLVIIFNISFSIDPLWDKLTARIRRSSSRSSSQPSGSDTQTSPVYPEQTEEESGEKPDTQSTEPSVSETKEEPVSSGGGGSVPVSFPHYDGPSLDLLEPLKASDEPDSGNLEEKKETIQSTLRNFGIEVEMGEVHQGPTVTRYLLRPVNAVKLSRITALQNDIALSLAAANIRIEAPVPGYSYAGIEVPNVKRAVLRLRALLESEPYQGGEMDLPLALGKNIMNEPVVVGLEKMPHLLMGGTTGSGKSMQLHSMILSLLYSNSPETLRLIFVDPKRVELSMYNNIPHLLTPVIVEEEKVVNALNWCVQEMERRYQIVASVGCRDIGAYNEYVKSGRLVETPNGEEEYEPLPYIVVVIDELADLMHSRKKEVEAPIVSIAAKARAVGIHLILATQRPSVDVVTGLIKANFPARIGLKVASNPDSRTILDASGGEHLLGNGDMLFSGSDIGQLQRIQGAYVSSKEMNDVIEAVKRSGPPTFDPNVVESNQPGGGRGLAGTESGGGDAKFDEAKEIVVASQKASASYIQRRLQVGYSRAARIVDELEEAGIVGPDRGSKPREVLVSSLEEEDV